MLANIYTCSAYYLLRKEIKKRWKPSFRYDPDAQQRMEAFIAEVPASKVFVHVALSATRLFSPAPDGYGWLKTLLCDRFSAVVTNAFTPSVIKSKTFDIREDRPVYGAFARKLFHDRTFRNADPLYSVCGAGDTGLDKNRFSFSPDGVFRQMIDQGYYGLNIDIDNITSSLLHFIELNCCPPYVEVHRDLFNIVTENGPRKENYLYYKYRKRYAVNNKTVMFSRNKIKKDLIRASILITQRHKGASVSYFSYKEFYDFITGKLEKNPFYLVTW